MSDFAENFLLGLLLFAILMLTLVTVKAMRFYSRIKKLKKTLYYLTGEDVRDDDTSSGDAEGRG